jgi:signal transduction histidine kinase
MGKTMFVVQVHGDESLCASLRSALENLPLTVETFDPSTPQPKRTLHVARHAEDLIDSVRGGDAPCVVFDAVGASPDLLICPANPPLANPPVGQPSEVPQSFGVLVAFVANNLCAHSTEIPYEKLHALFDEVVSIAHHDFSEPARNIAFFADFMCEGKLPDEKRDDFLHRTHIASVRLQALIRDLTRYARVWLRPCPEEVIEPDSIGEITAKAFIKARDRLIKPGNPGVANVEAIHIGRARLKMPTRFLEGMLEELLANALEHHPVDGAPIQVCLQDHTDEGRVQLEVRDEGPGILVPSGVSLFRPFYRNERNDELRTGIGLALVKALCERAGGEVLLIPQDSPERARLCLVVPGQICD